MVLRLKAGFRGALLGGVTEVPSLVLWHNLAVAVVIRMQSHTPQTLWPESWFRVQGLQYGLR